MLYEEILKRKIIEITKIFDTGKSLSNFGTAVQCDIRAI